MSFEYSTPAITKWNLDDLLEIIDTFEDVFADAVHHKLSIKKDYNTILLHIAGKTLITTRELVTLCAHGYSDGALSLGRNLYEQLIIVSFLEMHKNSTNFQDYVDDFFLSYEIQRNKCLRDIDKYIPDGNISNLNDNEYLKNFKSIKYLESDRYRKALQFMDTAPYQVYIMGHSCGNSDRTFLNTLFEHKNCVSIKPYYYKREDGTDNYLELVQNISRNFTDMKLMRDRVVNKLYCRPFSS